MDKITINNQKKELTKVRNLIKHLQKKEAQIVKFLKKEHQITRDTIKWDGSEKKTWKNKRPNTISRSQIIRRAKNK